MKILHIITRLIIGGAQENTLLTCEGLHALGHEVILLTGPSKGAEGSLLPRAQAGGYKVIVTPHLVRSPHPYHDFAAYRQIQRLCKELQPDVVHTHSSKAGILGRAAAWKIKTSHHVAPDGNPVVDVRARINRPLVVHTIHGLPFHPYQNAMINRLWITLERYAAKRCDAIICVADAMTRQALAAGVGRPDQFTTIYSGMEVEPFIHPGITRGEVRTRLNIPPTAFVYGTIARLQPLKGHDDLLAVAKKLFSAIPDAHLLWIGDGVFRKRFNRIIRKNGWTNRITLTGLVPPTDVPRLLPAMDALVHPSYREGLARALPQALLAKVPVISYDCDGAAEVCIDTQTGFIAKTGDTTALLFAMVRTAANRDQAIAMGVKGQSLALQNFSSNLMVERILNLYKQLQNKTNFSRPE